MVIYTVVIYTVVIYTVVIYRHFDGTIVRQRWPRFVGDLVHPNPVQPVQSGVVDVVGYHPGDDAVDRLR